MRLTEQYGEWLIALKNPIPVRLGCLSCKITLLLVLVTFNCNFIMILCNCCVGGNAVFGMEAESWANGIFYSEWMGARNDWATVSFTLLDCSDNNSSWFPLNSMSHYYWWTTFHLRPFVPPVKDCSTHLVHELLLTPDVFRLLLCLFGTNYLTLFDLLKLSEPFVPDWRHTYFPSLHHGHMLSHYWFTFLWN